MDLSSARLSHSLISLGWLLGCLVAYLLGYLVGLGQGADLSCISYHMPKLRDHTLANAINHSNSSDKRTRRRRGNLICLINKM